MHLDRREVLTLGAGFGVGALAAGLFASKARAADRTLELISRTHAIVPGAQTAGLMSYGTELPAVVRLPRNIETSIDVVNRLPEATTVHWHGLRVANSEDGVPFVTQQAIAAGATYRYRLKSPDAGTFWFHPHCNTIDQMSRGLSGLMIVDEDENPGFDLDLPLLVRDFRLGADAQFIDLTIPRNSARGGTLGTVSTANWQIEPIVDVPAGGLVRVRLLIADVTRVYWPSVTGAAARILAIDGHPVTVPIGFDGLAVGPGQRIDIAIAMPDQEGALVELSRQGGKGQVRIAALRARGSGLGRTLADAKPLPPNPVIEPDLARAETIPFVFGWSPGGDKPKPSICGTPEFAFWSINRVAWSDAEPTQPAPAAILRMGRSYVFRLMNETPNDHPIHLHGLAFKLLRSNKRTLPPLWTDTALLLKGETMDVGLVADNPGNWAFHCHVIEHQKTGLTGYVAVVD